MLNRLHPIQLLLFAVLLLSTPAPAETFHVDPTGDGSDGLSRVSAFSNIQNGVDRLRAGDTLLIHTGTYVNGALENIARITKGGTPGHPIIIQAAPGEHPVLRFDNWGAIKISGDVAYIEIIGLEIVGNNAAVTLERAKLQGKRTLRSSQNIAKLAIVFHGSK